MRGSIGHFRPLWGNVPLFHCSMFHSPFDHSYFLVPCPPSHRLRLQSLGTRWDRRKNYNPGGEVFFVARRQRNLFSPRTQIGKVVAPAFSTLEGAQKARGGKWEKQRELQHAQLDIGTRPRPVCVDCGVVFTWKAKNKVLIFQPHFLLLIIASLENDP